MGSGVSHTPYTHVVAVVFLFFHIVFARESVLALSSVGWSLFRLFCFCLVWCFFFFSLRGSEVWKWTKWWVLGLGISLVLVGVLSLCLLFI